MPLSIGVNLRVTGHCNQGGRKYMEDMFSVAYQQSSNDRELEYAFFGIFDGHGGGEAATFAKENLMDIIVKQKNFWSDDDEDVLKAIRDGYVNTHYAMWRELDKWPRTASGLPSTAGTTASIAFIRKGKIYIGHVGDSAIVLGYQEKGDPLWKSKALTRDHKPECAVEITRIQESGGKVVSKSGVPRVVWNRPRLGHKGPVRRSTHIDEIPFLAVARSLGDLWSYNSELNTFVVSPEPDVRVVKIDVKSHRCLIFGTDGLWNMLTPQAAVAIVQAAERHNEKHLIASQQTGSGSDVQMWINPSKSLVDRALDRWSSTRLRADNTSVVTLMLDPPGPTHSELLLSQKREQMASRVSAPVPESPESNSVHQPSENSPYPSNSSSSSIHKHHATPAEPAPIPSPYPYPATPLTAPPSYSDVQKHPDSSNHLVVETTTTTTTDIISSEDDSCLPLKEEDDDGELALTFSVSEEECIQVAEISSSNVADLDSSNIGSLEEPKTPLAEPDTPRVESSEELYEDEEEAAMSLLTRHESSLDKYVLERDTWLERVPVAEKYPEDINQDLQPIRHNSSNELVGPRLRRSEGTLLLGKRVMRQSAGRRRHSTGAPVGPGQRQRRSLTPKSAGAGVAVVVAGGYLSVGNKLKRGSKLMLGCEFDEPPRVGVGTVAGAGDGGECGYEAREAGAEPCLKRRTRSEDLRGLQDENSPANRKVEQHPRIRWPVTDTPISRTNGVLNSSTGGGLPEASFRRRNLEKKVTPMKAIRRPSINRSTPRSIQIRESYWDQGRASRTGASCAAVRRQSIIIAESMAGGGTPKRWLRSDTIAATPIKTLRSRNVDIGGQTVPAQLAHQYGAVKPTRLLDSASKLKQQQQQPGTPGLLARPATPHTPAVAKVKPVSCVSTAATTPNRTTKPSCNSTAVVGVTTTPCSSTTTTTTSSSSSISKRAKTPYNPSARSLSTRTRIKRFNK